MQYLDAGRERGARLIVVDPRATTTARGAPLHLQPVPGTDLALANGLLHIAIREGLVDEDYIADAHHRLRRGARAVRRTGRTGSSASPASRRRTSHESVAHPGRRAERAMILTARGAEQHRKGTDTVHRAASTWRWRSGCPARRLSGYGCLTGQGNGQGGREHGQKADQLPGYRRIDDPAARAHVAAVWGVDPDDLPGPGRRPTSCSTALGTDGGVRALLVMASNSVVSAPRGARPTGCGPRLPRRRPTSSSPRPPRSPTSCCRPPSGPRRTAR